MIIIIEFRNKFSNLTTCFFLYSSFTEHNESNFSITMKKKSGVLQHFPHEVRLDMMTCWMLKWIQYFYVYMRNYGIVLMTMMFILHLYPIQTHYSLKFSQERGLLSSTSYLCYKSYKWADNKWVLEGNILFSTEVLFY